MSQGRREVVERTWPGEGVICKSVRIADTESLLWSRDGRNWFSSPKALLATERRRAALGAKLKKELTDALSTAFRWDVEV